MSNKLKPCPFCGSSHVAAEGFEDMGMYRIRCGNCGSGVSTKDTVEKAIEAWNRRVPMVTVKNTCGDYYTSSSLLISRQAAINAIHDIEHIDCEGWELIDDIEECLKQLPSVEEQNKGKMTNREYLDSLSNMDFANFIYSKLLKIGKEYNDSVLGIAQWLGLEKSFENIVLSEPPSPIRDYCVDCTSETL